MPLAALATKKGAAENVKKWIKKAGPLDMLLYKDGSQEYDKVGNPSGTGAEWVIEWVVKKGSSGCVRSMARSWA